MQKKAQAGLGITIGIVVLIVASVFILALGIDRVDANAVGVLDRFGEIQGAMDGFDSAPRCAWNND